MASLEKKHSLALTHLHCTGPLREHMAAAGVMVPPSDKHETHDEHWLAHLLHIDKRLCLLFVHQPTLYSFMSVAVAPAQLSSLRQLFTSQLDRSLRYEKLPELQLQQARQTFQVMHFSRSIDKRILAHANDLVRTYRHQISKQKGILHCDIDAINFLCNRVALSHITNAISDAVPVDAAFSERLSMSSHDDAASRFARHFQWSLFDRKTLQEIS